MPEPADRPVESLFASGGSLRAALYAARPASRVRGRSTVAELPRDGVRRSPPARPTLVRSALLFVALLLAAGCRDTEPSAGATDVLSRTISALRRHGVHMKEVIEPRLDDRPCWLARVFPEHFDRNDRLRDELLDLLGRVPNLIVEFRYPGASDDAVVELAERVSLLGLAVERTRVGVRSLRALAGQSGLRLLKVDDTDLPAAAFVHLRTLKQMRMLYASRTGLDDSVATWLHELSDLRALKLAWTPITDTGVRSLAKLPRLEFLGLRGTRITDASVPALLRLKRLRYLDVRDTQLTRGAIDELELRLERCRVVSDADVETVRPTTPPDDPFRIGPAPSP